MQISVRVIYKIYIFSMSLFKKSGSFISLIKQNQIKAYGYHPDKPKKIPQEELIVFFKR